MKAIVTIIKLYRKFITPFIGRRCRFYPTCSAYAIEAVEKYGTVRGIFIAICRILKCHPFSQGGYDPVL